MRARNWIVVGALMCTMAACSADVTAGHSVPQDVIDNATVQLPLRTDGVYSWDGDEWTFEPSDDSPAFDCQAMGNRMCAGGYVDTMYLPDLARS